MALVYPPEAQRALLDLLRAAAPKLREPDTPSAGTIAEVHQRLLFELDREAGRITSEWRELRDGRFDRQVAILKKLDTFDRVVGELETFVKARRSHRIVRRRWQDRVLRLCIRIKTEADFEDVFDEYGPTLRPRAIRVIEDLRRASEFYRRRHAEPPGGIKSEGKNSANLARALLQDFLIAATLIRYQATGKAPSPSKSPQGEPVGDYSRFMDAAVQPIIDELNRDRSGRITDKWRTYYDALYRRLRVQTIELLGASLHKRAQPKIKRSQGIRRKLLK